ncbi:ferritin-like domain-containing protein [Christiangramia salexigens]|uniref:DUF2383 domain-containing protein n=1 Tax=Christiangramia salexigens TaxID=1913577 RepID=A0A1L3J370_9FLAO|nr:PA2169 family four-helix-bundle protein [Christiangramia salexigens]APG59575.1 hypothetical protein LPB144_03750 [Christiangramia salexigens]
MKTTREAAREASHNQVVKHLQELLEKNYDAEKGYKKAMEHTNNPHLKKFLSKQAVQRNHFATELDKQLHMLNEHPKENGTGSALGSIHRIWIDFKTSLSKHTDESILEECIRGEKASVREYEDKIRKNEFHPDIKIMMEDHLSSIRKTLTEVKILEDLED